MAKVLQVFSNTFINTLNCDKYNQCIHHDIYIHVYIHIYIHRQRKNERLTGFFYCVGLAQSVASVSASRTGKWGNALKRSPGIIRKSRVLYTGPGFLSSATWPSLPKKHYNG